MRPIKLVVKGLNSFKEEQTIDFNKLTDRGLFGIFGPTGSGKSTILDGITLALYGKTSRDSSNFINTQCDEMSVRYEFQIRDKIDKHYIVDRTFKRNKDGGINAKKPTRIIEVINGEQIVLEETPTTVDKKCIDIMGLKFEDFIRTVVLPQGKFSEFLKLGGKPRREMLERLFSLDKYGDGLAKKLGAALKKEKDQMLELTGHLKGYGDISEELYADKSKELELKKVQQSVIEKELEEANKRYLECERLWTLKQELEDHRKSEKELEEQKEIINEYKLKVEKGESLLKVKPYIDAVESTLQEIKTTKDNLLRDKLLFDKLTNDKKEIDIRFDEARIKKDKDIPKLKVIENNVNQAIEEDELKKKLTEGLVELRKSYKKFEDDRNQAEAERKKLEEEIEKLNNSITLNEQKVESMKINELHRNKVQQGLIAQEQLDQLNKRKNSLEQDVKETLNKIQTLKKNIDILEISIEEKNKLLTSLEQELEDVSNNCPGDSTLLLDMQGKISNLKATVEKGGNYKKELEQLTSEIVILSDLINNNKSTKAELIEEIEGLRKSIDEIKRENLASILREGLTDGVECPVCGSKEHNCINHEEIDNTVLEVKEKELAIKEANLSTITNELLTNEVKLKSNEEKKSLAEEELNKLGQEWMAVNIELLNNEFSLKKEAIEKWTSTKQNLEKNIKILNDGLSKIKINYSKDQSSLHENEIVFNKYSIELQHATEEFNNLFKECNSLKLELEIEDFSKRDIEIKQIDKERERLEKVIKTARSDIKGKEDKRDAHKKALSELVDKIATIRTQGEEKSKQVTEKDQSIKNKVGERTDLVDYKNEIIKEMERIEIAFINIEKQKDLIEQKCNECDGNIKAYELQLIKSESRIENEKSNLQEALKVEGFKDADEAISFLISSDKINQLREDITQYENNINQLKGKIQEVVNKIAGREITSEKWLEIQQLKSDKEKEFKEVRDTVVRINTELDELKKKLDELKDLIKEKERLDHKLSLLNDLDGLFKGKRFVEFVAIHQLKYVSLEASKRLKEITAGTYGLEVDEEGKFIIRDYKNGGATRDASTLSGGETFLASLSLALALSAQIQLKGTAPLELFFLDEGFGTLDDNLLEVVMESLEKIHNDKLSVGIISHVESIKNRVPVKLIIAPAQAGIGGSKVKIERT